MTTRTSSLTSLSRAGTRRADKPLVWSRANPPESQGTLQQALRTLRGIRQRYEMERTAHPDVRSYGMHVALGDSDMFWIAATIEALEKPIATGATEDAGPAARARPEA
jgi:hypothetical protein